MLEQVDHFEMTSAANTVIIGGGTASSSGIDFAINTDDVYMLVYTDVYMSNDGNVVNFRLTKSSDNSAVTTVSYANARTNLYSNQAHYHAGSQYLSYFPGIGCGTTTQEGQQGVMYLHNLANASAHSYINFEQQITTETPEYIGPMGGGQLNVSEAHNGVQFVANANNIANGKFTLYRII